MTKQKGGSGKGQGRKLDWGEKADGKMTVPHRIHEQKQSLIGSWKILENNGSNFDELYDFLQCHGISWLLNHNSSCASHYPQTYRKFATPVAASFGVVSSDDADAGGFDETYLEDVLGIKSPERTIFLEVTGHSMIDAGINHGAILTVETCGSTNKSWLAPQTGDIVVARIDGTDLTVKKFQRTDKGEFLVPRNAQNKAFQTLQLSSYESDFVEMHEVEIIGIVRKISFDP
jgi:SOS-response transcriptional repressor LexA